MENKKSLSKRGRSAIALTAISIFTALTGSETFAQNSSEDQTPETETEHCQITTTNFDGVQLRVGCGCGWLLNDWAIHGAKIAKDIKPSEKDLKNPYDPRNPKNFSGDESIDRKKAIANFVKASHLAWKRFQKCMENCDKRCEKRLDDDKKPDKDPQRTFRAPSQSQETPPSDQSASYSR